jgi:DNA modification methylase
VKIHHGDVLEVLKTLRPNTFDGGLCDPPYGLNFMGKAWDHGVPGADTWREVLRVLKPGAFLLAFGGTRTYHRLTCAIEDAGFEIRDCLMWMYGSGFPKAKSCLKPAWEPIILARKRGPMLPLAIDACRIGTNGGTRTGEMGPVPVTSTVYKSELSRRKESIPLQAGRWPANVILDAEAGLALDAASGLSRSSRRTGRRTASEGFGGRLREQQAVAMGHTDSGGASRFFYCAKASRAERAAGLENRIPEAVGDGRKKAIDNPFQRGKTPRLNTHPTVKPLKLTEYLARLILPAGGGKLIVPFAGSGSEMLGAKRAGWAVTGIEREQEYIAIAEARLKAAA